MPSPIGVGDPVQTVLGKGVVREVRRHGRLLVEVKGRALELDAGTVSRIDAGASSSKRDAPSPAASASSDGDDRVRPTARDEADLHGLTVEEALVRVDGLINEALLADKGELRLIHGQSGGRIRGALHKRLRGIASVRAFHLDPRNPGVTIVIF